MNALITMTRPEMDAIWPKLSTAQRLEAGQWIQILHRLERASDNQKGAELSLIMREHAGLKGLSKSTIYRKLDAFKAKGVAGIVHGSLVKRVTGAGSGLPKEFVAFWHGLCGLNQRQKAAAVYRHLFIEHLCAGKIIPGYGTDWRGIWAGENEGREVPSRCPYSVGGQHPHGWSYRNLDLMRPSKDVWAGAAQGAQAMRSLLPSVPHTRVGLAFGSLFVVDDVWHDQKVLFLGQAQAERPLELAMMECLTGRYVSWGLTPVTRREDGSRVMLKESYMRYLISDLLCRVGVNPNGITILAEHGTAAIRGGMLEEINAEIERLVGVKEFIKVETSSVYGAPLVAGLFAERPRGNPRFKAMLESSWNLLHNELAMLPGQVGKDRDNSPQDIKGRDDEVRAMMPIVNALIEEARPEVERMMTMGEYLSFYDFEKILRKVKGYIENRTDHHLEGWDACGFIRRVALIGGQDVDIDAQAADNPDMTSQLKELIRITRAPVQARAMSPVAAWHRCEMETELVRFPMSLSAIILGEACGKRCKVGDKGTISLTEEFGAKRTITFNALVNDGTGRVAELPRGETYICNLNPFDGRTLLVSDLAGRYVGCNSSPFLPATHGDREADKSNLALLSQAAAEQRKRLAPVIAAQQARRRDGVAAATNAMLGTLPREPKQIESDDPADMAELAPPKPVDSFWRDEDTQSDAFLDEITTGVK